MAADGAPASPPDCPVCLSLGRDRFDSEQEFIEFQRRLNRMTEEGLLRSEAEASPVEQPDFPQDHFACAACGTRWTLSHPDQAYRGFFRPRPGRGRG